MDVEKCVMMDDGARVRGITVQGASSYKNPGSDKFCDFMILKRDGFKIP